MRKLYFIFAIVLLSNFLISLCAFAEVSGFDDMLDEYEKKANEYTNGKQITANDSHNIIQELENTYGNDLKIDFGECVRIFLILITINLMSALFSSMSKNNDVTAIAEFSCYCISVFFIVTIFKTIADGCRDGIDNLTDFMTVSFPVLTGVMASGGYVSTASSMQINFAVVSVFLTNIINKLLIPLLYSCGLLGIIDGMTNTVNIGEFIVLIKKTVKYIIGISLTLFAGILTFTGFSGITADNLAMRTAKYAVANFVPVVGACLSEALTSMIHSSVILKNSIGIFGFSAIIAICFYPIVKTAMYVLMFKIIASALALISTSGVAKTAESISDILEMMMGIFLIITVVFILIITIAISLGI